MEIAPNVDRLYVKFACPLEEISTWQQNPQFATKLLDKLGTAPVAPDTVDLVLRCVRRAHALNIWQVNAATNAHVRRGRWQRALALAASLSDWSLEPDVVTASSCVRGCMESSHWLLSLAHLKHMKRMQAGISRYTKALLVPLKSTSSWRASLFHFANLADVRVEADLVSRGQVLGACKGRWPAAVQISSRVQVKQKLGATPPKKPLASDDSPVSTKKQEFPIVLKWYRISSIHSSSKRQDNLEPGTFLEETSCEAQASSKHGARRMSFDSTEEHFS